MIENSLASTIIISFSLSLILKADNYCNYYNQSQATFQGLFPAFEIQSHFAQHRKENYSFDNIQYISNFWLQPGGSSGQDNGMCSVVDGYGNVTESHCNQLNPFVCVRRPGR